jgi:uncharacterized protein YceK
VTAGTGASRRGRRRARALAAVLALGVALGGCATNAMLDASGRGALIGVPDDRTGESATSIEVEFVNAAAAFVCFPFTLVFDVVLFPWQIIAGYQPYGPRPWND